VVRLAAPLPPETLTVGEELLELDVVVEDYPGRVLDGGVLPSSRLRRLISKAFPSVKPHPAKVLYVAGRFSQTKGQIKYRVAENQETFPVLIVYYTLADTPECLPIPGFPTNSAHGPVRVVV
jgi:hypothetical protein